MRRSFDGPHHRRNCVLHRSLCGGKRRTWHHRSSRRSFRGPILNNFGGYFLWFAKCSCRAKLRSRGSWSLAFQTHCRRARRFAPMLWRNGNCSCPACLHASICRRRDRRCHVGLGRGMTKNYLALRLQTCRRRFRLRWWKNRSAIRHHRGRAVRSCRSADGSREVLTQ
jgi:hypothetical protein